MLEARTGEQARAGRTGEHSGHIQDTQSGQRSRRIDFPATGPCRGTLRPMDQRFGNHGLSLRVRLPCRPRPHRGCASLVRDDCRLEVIRAPSSHRLRHPRRTRRFAQRGKRRFQVMRRIRVQSNPSVRGLVITDHAVVQRALQDADGSWGARGGMDRWPLVNTSFALLFLSKGRNS